MEALGRVNSLKHRFTHTTCHVYSHSVFYLFHCRLSREERNFVQRLTVKPRAYGQHGNSNAPCWKYFGSLCDADGHVLDEDCVYCTLCLETQQALGDKGHVSQVTNYTATTSSGNMNLHLS